jgi:hypothetical protein
MSDLLIKPLRSYEDRGTIRNIDNEPYAAPVWLAKELEQLKLCEIVGEVDGEKNKSEGAGQGYKLQKKGQKWVVVDNEGAQVGNFIGKRDFPASGCRCRRYLSTLGGRSSSDPTGSGSTAGRAAAR